MDTSTTGNTGRVRVKNHTSRQLLDRQPTMHNVKITPVNSGYQLKFSQFSSDVYPDTGRTETIIAASMTKRQTNRQLQRAEGRQWKTTGLTTFDVNTKDRRQGWRLQSRQRWKTDQTCSKWIKLVQNGSNLLKLDEIVSKWLNVAQIGSNRFKIF